ncbi:MAG TPA: peptide deformylase [Candidatus Saccharimonadia bacterium]|nr:peptide deformylase [Candidatus Saccharimonadia bacterium]
MQILKRTQFGNPILRAQTKQLSVSEIKSVDIQSFLKDMRYTLDKKQYGIGLAATQVGRDLAISVVGLKPTPTRPNIEKLDMVLINPRITKFYGKKTGMWEGCISGSELYGKALRYEKVRLSWLDENAKKHEKDFEGILAQVIQHEVDHTNGILFVDRVKDPKTYTTFSEYRKLRKAENNKSKA